MKELPDALADVLGGIIADVRREGRKELELLAMEARAMMAEMRNEIAILKAEIKNGRDGEPGPAGKDGRDGKNGDPGPAGTDGKDGNGMIAAMINREGRLIFTMADGAACDLGLVVGRDGEQGKPGRDGFSLKNFDTEMLPDGRTVLLKFESGDTLETHELRFAIPMDRGVYKFGTRYQHGDAATYGGSLWIAQKDTDAKPGDDDSWRLAVKRGRDGKDGKDGPPGPQGPKGDK